MIIILLSFQSLVGLFFYFKSYLLSYIFLDSLGLLTFKVCIISIGGYHSVILV